jgi:hypothetical protein
VLWRLAHGPKPAAATDSTGEPAPHDADYAAVRDIHARWLATPRDDLRGQAPRDWLLAKRKFIDLDLQYREFQWSHMGACPRGIELDSHAFLFSGFGTHEIVKYYDLVRELLWACHDSARERVHSESLARGDFLAAEVPRLKRVRDEWLASPDPECHGLTPRQIIEQSEPGFPKV